MTKRNPAVARKRMAYLQLAGLLVLVVITAFVVYKSMQVG